MVFQDRLVDIVIKSLFFGLFFIAIGLSSPAYSYFKQEQFYDWGMETGIKQNILGVNTSAENELPEPGLLPDSPFYFGKRLTEQARLFFTFDNKTKAKHRLSLANVRLAEAKTLIEAGKIKEGLSIINDFENRIKEVADDFSTIESQGKNIDDLAKLLEKSTAVQTSVLESISPTLTDNNQTVINEALASTQAGMDRAAQTLGEPPIPIDLLARLNSLRGQGLISQEEATNMLQVKKREEARELFRKYVDQGIIPTADFKRFDSGQMKYFANDFIRAVEINKFKELVDLEKQSVDEPTRRKIEEFAKTYKPGDIVPPELRGSWSRTVRLEEVQKTISPDKIDDRLLQKNPLFFEKFQEIKDRVRPTTDEARYAEEYIKNNPGADIPPEIARIISLKEKFGIVKTGERPPPGHQEAIFLPQEIFKFQEIPYQVRPPANLAGGKNEPGGFNYQNYLQEANFLPPPSKEAPKEIKCPTGSTWNGWMCFFPQEFRQPFTPPSPPPTAPDQPPPSYKPYNETSPGVFVPPPPSTQNSPQTGVQNPLSPGSPPPNQAQPAPQNPASCPPGSSWNGSTCHFPPSDQGSDQSPRNNPPPQDNPPPNNPPLPPEGSGGENR